MIQSVELKHRAKGFFRVNCLKSEKKKHKKKTLNPRGAFGNVPLHPHLHVAGTPPCGKDGGCEGQCRRIL